MTMSETMVGSGSGPAFEVDQFVEIAQGPLEEPPKFEHELGFIMGADVDIAVADTEVDLGAMIPDQFECCTVQGSDRVYYVVGFNGARKGVYPEECLVPRHVGCGPKRAPEPTEREVLNLMSEIGSEIVDETEDDETGWLWTRIRRWVPWL